MMRVARQFLLCNRQLLATVGERRTRPGEQTQVMIVAARFPGRAGC